jgi:hypothetical protein
MGWLSGWSPARNPAREHQEIECANQTDRRLGPVWLSPRETTLAEALAAEEGMGHRGGCDAVNNVVGRDELRLMLANMLVNHVPKSRKSST